VADQGGGIREGALLCLLMLAVALGDLAHRE
jgi:hypothetical protein